MSDLRDWVCSLERNPWDCTANKYPYRYNNGSILIATIQPFTILHTLTTSRGPSSIVSLAWHASSTKQKSDMLASQTVEGDLLVWSVSKHPANETPRVIRSLKRSEYGSPGPKWLAWSKNGRIVQYAEGYFFFFMLISLSCRFR